VKVKLEIGDLLILNGSETHGIRPNRSGDKVLLAQQLSTLPAQEENEALRPWRIAAWRDRWSPEGHAVPGDPRNWEQTWCGAAVLSELGERFLGVRSCGVVGWDEEFGRRAVMG
jgi:hypothetical protein